MPVFLDDPISLDSLVPLDGGVSVPSTILDSKVVVTAAANSTTIRSGANSVTIDS